MALQKPTYLLQSCCYYSKNFLLLVSWLFIGPFWPISHGRISINVLVYRRAPPPIRAKAGALAKAASNWNIIFLVVEITAVSIDSTI